MVGFDVRTHVVEDDGTWKVCATLFYSLFKSIHLTFSSNTEQYGYMSTTEKSNKYSLSLPRYCFIHADYLNSYMTQLPRPIFTRVQEIFNCEDIAMSFWISRMTGGRPPLLADYWAVKSMTKLYSPETISGTKNHKKLRDACVNDFADLLGLKTMMQKATIVHKHEHMFECGAEGDKKPPPNWRLVDRNAELQKKIHHWKHLAKDRQMSEVLKLRSHMIRHAYVMGLIADTTPWKERWHKKR